MTYIDRSTMSTISVSLWPMPAVSTTIRSKPAHFSSWIVSVSTALVARWARRVASERMNTCSLASAFMRMRSPSRAPPERRRVGSIATTAIRRSGKNRTTRLSSSSVSEDLPAPPVPVMPMTGGRFRVLPAALRISAVRAESPPSRTEIVRAICAVSSTVSGASLNSGRRQARTRANTSSIIPSRPSLKPSSGV